MHQQIRVTADGAGEMRVGLERQTKMAAVDWRVDGLLHRAQQHRMDLLRIRAVFGGVGNGLKLTGPRVVAHANVQAHGLQVTIQGLALFRCGAFVHAVQAGLFVL